MKYKCIQQFMSIRMAYHVGIQINIYHIPNKIIQCQLNGKKGGEKDRMSIHVLYLYRNDKTLKLLKISGGKHDELNQQLRQQPLSPLVICLPVQDLCNMRHVCHCFLKHDDANNRSTCQRKIKTSCLLHDFNFETGHHVSTHKT